MKLAFVVHINTEMIAVTCLRADASHSYIVTTLLKLQLQLRTVHVMVPKRHPTQTGEATSSPSQILPSTSVTVLSSSIPTARLILKCSIMACR